MAIYWARNVSFQLKLRPKLRKCKCLSHGVSTRNKSELQEHFMRKKCKLFLKTGSIARKNVSYISFCTLCDFSMASYIYPPFIPKPASQAFNYKLLTFDNGNSLMTEQFTLHKPMRHRI